jgi:nucleoside-diphosphate-sugar epimerase
MKKALVCGAGGFIGNQLVSRLKTEGYWVRGVDLKKPEFCTTDADEFVTHDLRDRNVCDRVTRFHGEQGNYYQSVPQQHTQPFDEIYQLAADMGGAGFIFTGDNDADIMHNSATINLNILDAVHSLNTEKNTNKTKLFYSSSACMYPEHNQLDPNNPNCAEDSAYPANPDSEYGWEKLFSERLYFAYNRNYDIPVRVARFHNIFGPLGTWEGGREKAPAAICRKVLEAYDEIEIWGNGTQTRSFLYIDECVEGIRRLMESEFIGPVNIGSDEMVTINQLVDYACEIGGKKLSKMHIPGPLGVRGRNSDNKLIKEKLDWAPSQPLKEGLEHTYKWIQRQIEARDAARAAL